MTLLLAIAFGASRIVSLSPTATEIICALDACSALVGVTRFDDYPPEVTRLPKVGGFVDPSIEATMGLRPSLVVVTKNGSNTSFSEALRKAKLPQLVLADERLSDFAVMARALGEVLDKQTRAEALIASFDAGIARLPRSPVSSAVLVYGHRPLVIGGPGSFGSEILAAAGIANAYAGNQRYATIDLEALLALAPRVIIDVDMSGDGQTDEAYYAPVRALLQKRGVRLVFAPDPRLLRLGPRLPEAVGTLLQRLGPP